MQGADRLQLTFVAGYRSLSTQSTTQKKRKTYRTKGARACKAKSSRPVIECLKSCWWTLAANQAH